MDNPEYWRFRAEEVRTIAEDMKAGEPKAIMLRIAEDYERIAKLVEQGVYALRFPFPFTDLLRQRRPVTTTIRCGPF
ncbi:MAG TPA: hypothetical protein VKG24_25425 [Pseudolabrys sp.]|nr:hypothetical protein [Pseudolabrys sp.]